LATRTTVALEDDLEGGPAEEMVRFSLSGAEYEIDLSAANATKFRHQLAPFAAHARKVGAGQRLRPPRTAASRERGGDIRVWAKENGIKLGDRGRIPASVIEQYQAATRSR